MRNSWPMPPPVSNQLLCRWRSLAGGQERTRGRPRADLIGGLHALAQYARQQQESDPGHSRQHSRRISPASAATSISFERPARFATYREVVPDVVGGSASARRPHHRLGRPQPAHARPLPDGSEPGARLCARRHRSARSDPVSVHRGGRGRARRHALLGHASSSFRRRSFFLPKDAGIKLAAFADAGSLWNYVGPTTFPATGEVLSGSICATPPCPVDNAMHVRSSVGVGLLWEFPFGPLRFDYSYPAHIAALRPNPAVPLRRRRTKF